MSDSNLHDLLLRVQSGDEEAAVDIWNSYYKRLLRVARSKLSGMPFRAVDEEDVAASAMRSFFFKIRQGEKLPDDESALWGLLATITVRKALTQLRKHYTEKRGGGAVRGDSAFEELEKPSPALGVFPEDVDIEDLSPHLGAACEELLASLNDAALQRIVLLRIADHTTAEIAEKIGCSVGTVKRRFAEIRNCWRMIDK